MNTIALKTIVTTEDGEVLDSATIVLEFDLSKRLLDRVNAVPLSTGVREAGSLFESALRIAFARAKKAAL